jgi:hypothetical protein
MLLRLAQKKPDDIFSRIAKKTHQMGDRAQSALHIPHSGGHHDDHEGHGGGHGGHGGGHKNMSISDNHHHIGANGNGNADRGSTGALFQETAGMPGSMLDQRPTGKVTPSMPTKRPSLPAIQPALTPVESPIPPLASGGYPALVPITGAKKNQVAPLPQ